jgi:hypothetical protein
VQPRSRILFAATACIPEISACENEPLPDASAVTLRPRIATLRRCPGVIALERKLRRQRYQDIIEDIFEALTKHKASDGPLIITFSLPQLFPWF